MAKFSKRHYQAIADMLRRVKESHRLHFAERSEFPAEAVGYQNGVDDVAICLCGVFAQDNSRFNREHFLAVVRGERPVNSKPPRS